MSILNEAKKSGLSTAEYIATHAISTAELAADTNQMIDDMLQAIEHCTDADVTFLPQDPNKHDPYASNPTEADLAWTLGHVIVHTTASSEESAALASELARGVPFHGRSRYETPWQEMITIQACRQRLEESRRIRLSSLQMWPDSPNLGLTYQAWPNGPIVNAIGRFLLGLGHDADHLGQIREIVRQAHAK